MAIVRYLVSMAGTPVSIAPGDEREVSDAEAGRLVEAGFAEIVTPPVVANQTGDDTGEYPAVKSVVEEPVHKQISLEIDPVPVMAKIVPVKPKRK